MPEKKVEGLATEIIGIAIEVHKQIGPGYSEIIYQRALNIALNNRKVKFVREKSFKIYFDDKEIGTSRLDFMIEDELIVETKAQDEVNSFHISQMLSYLKATKRNLGLILNFGQARLEIKRVIL